jgi:protocatechuate 3,4-dioxygenase beta subunit
VRLVLRTGWVLTGRVRDENGRPLAGVAVDLDDGTSLVTDDMGVFDAGMRRGRVTIVVRGPKMAPEVREATVAGADLDLDVVLRDADGVLRGRVVDGNHRPLADVQVLLEPEDGLSPSAFSYTDDKGTFELTGLVPGPVRVELDHPDHRTERVGAFVREHPGGPSLEIVLQGGATLRLLVRELGTGRAIAGARVTVTLHGDTRVGATGSGGKVAFSRLGAGAARLEVEAEGFVPERRRLDLGAVTDELLVELREGGGLEGDVTDDRGDAVVGAAVLILDAGASEVLARTVTFDRGAFVFGGIPEGAVIVRVEPPRERGAELAPTSVASDVLRGKVTRGVRLRLARR